MALLPVVAGISYEIIKIAGKLVRIYGHSQLSGDDAKLTTSEPDDSQIEVAIEALKNVLVENEDEVLW